MVSIGNALARDHTTTQIIDYSGGTTPHTIAYLEGLLHVKATAPTTPVKNSPYDIKVVVGSDYAPATTPQSVNR